MKRSASMLAGLIRVKNELPDDPKALEEMIQDFRGCGDSGSWHKHTSCMIHINSSFRTKFREDLQLELTADNVLPGYPGSPAPTLPATDSHLLVAGRQTVGPSCGGSETWLSLYSGACFRGCRSHVLRRQLKLTMVCEPRRMYIWLHRMMKAMLP